MHIDLSRVAKPNNKLYKLYNQLVDVTIDEFKLTRNPQESFRSETDKAGVDYGDQLKSTELTIELHLRTQFEVPKDSKLNVSDFPALRLSISFSNKFGIEFFYDSVILQDSSQLNNLERLFSEKILLAKREKLNLLKYYFGDSPFIVLGENGISKSAQDMEMVIGGYFQLPMMGYSRKHQDKLLVWEIIHGKKPDRGFSYVIGLDRRLIVFPDFCGDQGGEGRSSLQTIKKFLSDAKAKGMVKLISFEWDLDEFLDFFNRYDVPFSTQFKDEIEDNAWELRKLLRSKVVSGGHRDLNKEIRYFLEDVRNKRYSSLQNSKVSTLEALIRNYYLLENVGNNSLSLTDMTRELYRNKMITDVTYACVLLNERNAQSHGQHGYYLAYPLFGILVRLLGLRGIIEDHIRWQIFKELLPTMVTDWSTYSSMTCYLTNKWKDYEFKIESNVMAKNDDGISFFLKVKKEKIRGRYKLEENKIESSQKIIQQEF